MLVNQVIFNVKVKKSLNFLISATLYAEKLYFLHLIELILMLFALFLKKHFGYIRTTAGNKR